MLALVRTPTGSTCKGVLQPETTFIDMKNMYQHRGLEPRFLVYHPSAVVAYNKMLIYLNIHISRGIFPWLSLKETYNLRILMYSFSFKN